MMCSVACLLRFSAGSLSVNSDSSALPTTGSCANSAACSTTTAAKRNNRLVRSSHGAPQVVISGQEMIGG